MITDYNYNYFLSECNQLQLTLLYKSNHVYFMITYDYLPRVTLFRVGEYITVYVSSLHDLQRNEGVVGCGEGVVYLTSVGRPTDIGLQLGKVCYPCSR